VTATAADYVVAAQALAASAGPVVAGPAFDAAVARWPDESLVWLALGNLRLMRNEDRAAEDAFGEAVRRRPGDTAARNNRALLLARRGCVAEARVEINLALKDATGTPLEASVADSARQIRQSTAGATATGCPAP
jgi:Flp pilus assembly protein TadD